MVLNISELSVIVICHANLNGFMIQIVTTFLRQIYRDLEMKMQSSSTYGLIKQTILWACYNGNILWFVRDFQLQKGEAASLLGSEVGCRVEGRAIDTALEQCFIPNSSH